LHLCDKVHYFVKTKNIIDLRYEKVNHSYIGAAGPVPN